MRRSEPTGGGACKRGATSEHVSRQRQHTAIVFQQTCVRRIPPLPLALALPDAFLIAQAHQGRARHPGRPWVMAPALTMLLALALALPGAAHGSTCGATLPAVCYASATWCAPTSPALRAAGGEAAPAPDPAGDLKHDHKPLWPLEPRDVASFAVAALALLLAASSGGWSGRGGGGQPAALPTTPRLGWLLQGLVAARCWCPSRW